MIDYNSKFKLCNNLYIGNTFICKDNDYKTIHINHPSHVNKKGDIYLNIDDAGGQYSEHQYLLEYQRGAKFIEQYIDSEKMYVHCSAGVSRSALVCLLYLARTSQIRNKTFEEANEDFEKIYPRYYPMTFYKSFFTKFWKELLK